MKKILNNKHHFLSVLIFLVISFGYFTALLEGKEIEAHDTKTWKGISKEVRDFRAENDEEALWTNRLFGGMPAYLVSMSYKSNLVRYVSEFLQLGIPRPADMLFLYLLGFYFLLISLNINYRIAILGSIAFAFSTYFLIIIQAGHMTKAHAIAYIPMVVGAVLYSFRGKILLGGVLTALTVAMQIYANHLQISYYTALILLVIGIVELYYRIKENNINDFLKRASILLLAAFLAAGTSMTRLLVTSEYGEYSIRGKSELSENQDNKTSGLDKDYATQWSYGIAETLTLLIPNFYGGASTGELSEKSKTYEAIKRAPNAKKIIKQLPLYWGSQPITSGPTYVGSIVVFLFVLGLFIVKGRFKYWILFATVLSILLAWGKNFMFLTDLFLDYFPAYNKFRAVSMILVVAEFTIPLLAIMALDTALKFKKDSKLIIENKLKYSYYIVGGFCLVLALLPSLAGDFSGMQDQTLQANGFPIDAIVEDRKTLLSSDAFRSFVFITISFILILVFLRGKLKSNLLITILTLLILFDLWPINKRYLNDDNFERKSKLKTVYKQTPADRLILADSDINFRVFNQSVNTFNDASTSYYHNSIGGYHGAKLRRYQDLIEKHISSGNMKVLNMLNTKYFIDRSGKVQINPGALGNAWFIDNIVFVKNADEEISNLNDFDPFNEIVVNESFKNLISKNQYSKTNQKISLKDYKPNHLTYIAEVNETSLLAFSEIYYDKGWNLYLNGEEHPYFRANYVLRAMEVPEGNHKIEFKFEPEKYYLGEKISLASSAVLIILLVFVGYRELK